MTAPVSIPKTWLIRSYLFLLLHKSNRSCIFLLDGLPFLITSCILRWRYIHPQMHSPIHYFCPFYKRLSIFPVSNHMVGNPIKFHWISLNPIKFYQIPLNFIKFHKIPGCLLINHDNGGSTDAKAGDKFLLNNIPSHLGIVPNVYSSASVSSKRLWPFHYCGGSSSRKWAWREASLRISSGATLPWQTQDSPSRIIQRERCSSPYRPSWQMGHEFYLPPCTAWRA